MKAASFLARSTYATSAFVRAFLAILALELEDIVVRSVGPPKLAGVHGYRAWPAVEDLEERATARGRRGRGMTAVNDEGWRTVPTSDRRDLRLVTGRLVGIEEKGRPQHADGLSGIKIIYLCKSTPLPRRKRILVPCRPFWNV